MISNHGGTYQGGLNPEMQRLTADYSSEEKEILPKEESTDISGVGTTIIHELAGSKGSSDSSETPAFGTTVVKDLAEESKVDFSNVDLSAVGTPPVSIEQKVAPPHPRIPSAFAKGIYSKTKEETAEELVPTASQKHVKKKVHLHAHKVPKGIQKPLQIKFKKARRRNIPSLLVSQTKVYGSKPKKAELSESGNHEIDFMEIDPNEVPGGPITYSYPVQKEDVEKVETAENTSSVSEKPKPATKKEGFLVGLFKKVHSFAMKFFNLILQGFYKIANFLGMKQTKAKVDTLVRKPSTLDERRDSYMRLLFKTQVSTNFRPRLF